MKITSQTTVFSEEANLLLLLLLLSLPILLFFLINHLRNSWSIFRSSSLPPGPFPWPIIGNILQLGTNPHLSLARLAQTYGPLFSLKLGNQLLVIGSSPSAAMEILKTHDKSLSGRYVPNTLAAKSPELNKFSLGWSLECNELWRNLRTLCRDELFSSKAIGTQACIREKKVKEMLEFIGKRQGQVVKIRELVAAVVFNMISNIVVSKDVVNLEDESENGEINRLVRNVVELVSTPNISDIYPLLAPLDIQGLRKKALEQHEKSNKMWKEIIKERKEIRKSRIGDSTHQHDLLDAIINKGCPDDQVNVLFLELFIAGTDTSSLAIEWTMAELIRNPRCLKIVEDELAREINQEDFIAESHVPNLTYLQACIKEALRLYPPIPYLVPHRAVESCQVMNHTIPKDSMILMNLWAIGRDPNYWEDPSEFKPERFLNSSLDFKGNDFQLIPFGSGRRICPGLPMAALHVPLIVASLIHFFDWSLPLGKDPRDLDMTEKSGLDMVKKVPLLLVPRTKF
ncbi:(S)-N-methylcoclaurine 3'-hydroxylase isozyme 1 [Ziziphus jujuba]|uniref:(S)-N-methylcoclaurine 3'-hydroxylase isozyme 1 n=1 Tax=Ziziphus jujuba TaxID=326968 RepID=A0A6P4BB89_ZIZJJ|nr:(S)-N-methylcoclaurine 3'-hydroxylase isozyme 1 [Ziziphus jujuba]